MKKILTLVFLIPLLVFAQSELIIQGDVVNLRKIADVKGEVVTKAKRFDILKVIETGKEATVNGITDNWYKVKTETGKIGYVFGHFTSWKREGQVTKTMTLTEVSLGDCFHLIFDGIDFGNARNDLGNFKDIEDDAYSDNPIYNGVMFNVTYNSLFTLHSDACSPDFPLELIQTPTIVRIERVE